MKGIKDFFGKSILHDYEIGEIKVDYSNGKINFIFITPNGKMEEYIIRNFTSIALSKKEEWGRGTYIVSSDAFVTNGIWNVKIQLNSGDICEIECYE